MAASPWRKPILAWVVAFLASVVALGALWSYARIATRSRPPMFVDFVYPRGVESLASLNGGFALSPDGTSLAMIGVREGGRRFFVRRLEQPEAVEIPDTQGVSNVTFSPDGRRSPTTTPRLLGRIPTR
jgi:hypothetical protein